MTNIIILAAVAMFLFWRLFSILGNREGHEPQPTKNTTTLDTNLSIEVEEKTSIDNDIADYIDIESDSGKALKQIKTYDDSFTVKEFISGAKIAYEMIIVAFEGGDAEKLRPLLLDEVFEAFSSVIDERADKGYTVDLEFGGVREIRLKEVLFDKKTKNAEVTVAFLSDISSAIKDSEGKVIEGDLHKVKKQKDVWTFYKDLSKKEPNWFLSSTNG